MPEVLVGTATKVTAETKVKLGLALGLSGAAFAALAAGVGGFPKVTTVTVSPDTRAYTGSLRPAPQVVLGRFSVAVKGAPVNIENITITITTRRTDVSLVGAPYHLVVYVCGGSGNYGYTYGYGGCRMIDVSKQQLINLTKSQQVTKFVLPPAVRVSQDNRAWIDIVAGVKMPPVQDASLRVAVSGLWASSGISRVQTRSAGPGRWRRILTAGDVLQVARKAALYYIDVVGQRHVFPNALTYQTWYGVRRDIVTVGSDVVQAYPLGENVRIRPGTKLIKTTSNKAVYAIDDKSALRLLASDTAAERLYGRDWRSRIVDVPDVFFVNYILGEALDRRSSHPGGALIQYKNSNAFYLITGSGEKRLLTTAGMQLNRFDTRYAVRDVDPALFRYTDGPPIVLYEPALGIPAGPIQ